MKPQIRYEAEWIERQHKVNGEWDPDRDEYASAYRRTRMTAERAAIKASKKTGIEWIRVTKQELRPHRNLPIDEWVDVCRWSGDWDGLHWEKEEIL